MGRRKATAIRFKLPQASEIIIRIYNIRGELVRELIEGKLNAGVHSLRFDANGLASGIYFYRLQAGAFMQTRKMVLAR